MECQVEDDRMDSADFLLREVLNFCLHSSVCKSLNISFTDLMGMDYATYKQIRDLIEKRDSKIASEHKDMLQKQDKLEKDVRNAAKRAASI